MGRHPEQTSEEHRAFGHVLPVRKPVGWTSFDVIRYIKTRMPGIKVGHAGTLDPFAEGVLVVCTGKATKRIDEFVHAKKAYRALMRLGVTTDTLDVTGRITGHGDADEIRAEQIQQILPRFVGEIDQVPPQFSALRINGKRAYHLARAGHEVEMKKRRVRIYRLELIAFEAGLLTINIECSKGTYIRSLARDIAKALNTVGYVQTLIRTAVGDYTLRDTQELDSLIPDLVR